MNKKSNNSTEQYKYNYVFTINKEHLELFINLYRNNITTLINDNSNVNIRRLHSSQGCGYNLSSNSLLAIEEVKRKLYHFSIVVENEYKEIKFQNKIFKERLIRQKQYEAAEKIKRNIITELKIKQETEPEELEEELTITNSSTKTTHIPKVLVNMKNKFSLLEIED